jgi:hypothetical protein
LFADLQRELLRRVVRIESRQKEMLRELNFLNRGLMLQVASPKVEEKSMAPPPPVSLQDRKHVNAIFARFFPIKNESDKNIVEEKLLDETFVSLVVSF